MQSKSNSVVDPSIFKIRLTVVLVLPRWGNRCHHFTSQHVVDAKSSSFQFWSFVSDSDPFAKGQQKTLLWSYLDFFGAICTSQSLGVPCWSMNFWNIRDVEYPAFHVWLSWYVQALPQHWPFCFPHQLSTITFRQVGALEGDTGSPSVHAQWFSEKWRDCQIFWPWIGRLLAQPTLWCMSEWRQTSPPIPRSSEWSSVWLMKLMWKITTEKKREDKLSTCFPSG